MKSQGARPGSVMKKMESSDIFALLESDHEKVIQKTNALIEDLNNMHCEGKASFQKNLGRVKEALHFFNGEVMEHMALEERTLFPYLETHVPRVSSAIRFLQAEHDDFRNNLKIFEFLVRELSRHKNDAERSKTVDRIRETGTYLSYLLRHHIEAEQRSVYHSLERDLKASEKSELQKRILKP